MTLDIKVETRHTAFCLDLTRMAAEARQTAVLTEREAGRRSARQWDAYADHLVETAMRHCTANCVPTAVLSEA